MVSPPCVLFLLDWRPTFWSTREEYYRQLARRLSERGVTAVLMVSELDSSSNGAEARRRLESAGARLEVCSYGNGMIAYWRRIRWLRREFSVRLAHVRFFDYFAAVHWICRLAGVRTIVFTEANSGDWNGAGWRRTLVRLRTAVMCRPLTRLVAISEFIRRRLQKVGIAPERIATVYNGVDLAAFSPDPEASAEIRRQMGASGQTVVLIFAASLLAWKRPEIALEVCAELVRRGCPVQLWMAGRGPLREQLEQHATRLGISDDVHWLGYQKEPQRWMAAADLFLHTAEGEAFGNVFIEAMGCGLPVVASRSGSAPELIVEGEPDSAHPGTGRLIDLGPEEVSGLADAVVELTEHSERYAAISQAAIRHAKRFSIEASVDGILAVYDSLSD